MYYVSFIIQNECDARAWRCSFYDGCPNLDEAKRLVELSRNTHNILAAWITDAANNKIRFFECYVDIAGNVTK